MNQNTVLSITVFIIAVLLTLALLGLGIYYAILASKSTENPEKTNLSIKSASFFIAFIAGTVMGVLTGINTFKK